MAMLPNVAIMMTCLPGRFLITGSVRGDVDPPTWPGTGRLLRVAMFGLTVGEIRRSLPQKQAAHLRAMTPATPRGYLPN
jgi:hypothetical protein